MVAWGNLAERKEFLIQSCSEYGTPQYILDERVLKRGCSEILSVFRERYPDTRVYYPYKTNSIPYLLKIIHGYGIGAEVSSLLELKLADRLGVSDVVFNSPGKIMEEIIYAIEKSVVIVIDNLNELEKIRKASDTVGETPVLGVRLSLHGVRGGEWSRFGVPVKKMPELLEKLGGMDLTLSGLHFHIGSGFKSPAPYESALRELGLLLKSGLFEKAGNPLHFIDIGGGFSTAGSRHKDLLDYTFNLVEKYSGYTGLRPLRDYNYGGVESIQSFADRICGSFKSEVASVLGDVELWVEPGRWLVSECIHLLTTVLALKEDGVVVDAGINLLPNVLHENYPVVNLSKHSEEKTRVTVYGPLCMSNDRISSQLYGGRPGVGDVLCVMNVGAYNVGWSQQFIKPLAKVVSLSEGGLKEVRREEDLEYRIGRDAGI
jgi:diaminopimelate decarboxylase